jgi:hypothetical protein
VTGYSGQHALREIANDRQRLAAATPPSVRDVLGTLRITPTIRRESSSLARSVLGPRAAAAGRLLVEWLARARAVDCAVAWKYSAPKCSAPSPAGCVDIPSATSNEGLADFILDQRVSISP